MGEDKPAGTFGSFRDPSGFIFKSGGQIYRQINKSYRDNYDVLMKSGLYERLTSDGLLISHETTNIDPPDPEAAFLVMKPERIPFISYPYEWCFGQLKDAATLTLKIQKIALEHGMSLKDASAFNVQFKGCRPILIDTLSFEKYVEGRPWIAYRQFCQHFLAPLALMAHTDVRLGWLLENYIDGIPLDLAAKLLPKRTRFSFPLLANIHLHARTLKRAAGREPDIKNRKMSKTALTSVIGNLQSAIGGLKWEPSHSLWSDYYDDNNYSKPSFDRKLNIVDKFLKAIKPTEVWDLGANTGVFSRLASKLNIPTVTFDQDYAAVEISYRNARKDDERYLLPLVMEIFNPSGGTGWENRERLSFSDRGPTDTVLALALIHHLAIGNNVPLDQAAKFFAVICNKLIIEFVPKEDSQVKQMLSSREDIFVNYDYDGFRKAFEKYFEIKESEPIDNTARSIHLMLKRS